MCPDVLFAIKLNPSVDFNMAAFVPMCTHAAFLCAMRLVLRQTSGRPPQNMFQMQPHVLLLKDLPACTLAFRTQVNMPEQKYHPTV